MEHLTVKYMQMVKHILRYIKGTMDYGLVYVKGCEEDIIIRYTDSDLARDITDIRFKTGVTFYLNENLVT